MNMQNRQKLNAFLSAAISATAALAIMQGYLPGSNPLLYLLGGMILAAGAALLIEDLTEKQANLGSSDLILGTGKVLLGGYVLLYTAGVLPESAGLSLHLLIGGILLYHALVLLQMAAEVRFLDAEKAKRILPAAGVSLAAAILEFLWPAGSGEVVVAELCLLADAAAVLVTAVLVLRLRADVPKAAVSAAASKAPDAVSAPDGKPVAADAATPDAADSEAAQKAAAEAAAAEAARLAAEKAEEEQDAAEAADAMRSLGRAFRKTGNRISDTAAKTAAGFREGAASGKP